MATLRARTSFHSPFGAFADGDEVDSKDPVVKGRESLFEAVDAPPAVKAPAKKAAAKKAAPRARS